MAKNIGTLITAPIRPNDSRDRIATALSNEIEGGIHSVVERTITDVNGTDVFPIHNSMFAIPVERRTWGMLCFVENDFKTYQLKNNNGTITDNTNWEEFGVVNYNGVSEWKDPIINSIGSTASLTPSIGDRYIFTGNNNIIEWNGSNWNDLAEIPVDGTSVRKISELDTIYRYTGTVWIKERLNQVIYIEASGNGAYTSSNQILESDVIYIVKFDYDNTIDNPTLDAIEIKKSDGENLNSITKGSISKDVLHILIYNGTDFEIQSDINEEIEEIDIHFVNKLILDYRVSYKYKITAIEDTEGSTVPNIIQEIEHNGNIYSGTSILGANIDINPYETLIIRANNTGNIVLKTKII